MKRCPKCNIVKDNESFYIERSGKRKGKLTSYCKDCNRAMSAERYKKDPAKCKEEHSKWVQNNRERVAFTKAKSAYGITKEQYEHMPRICQICGSTENLVIDHSHQSGRVRGMLCHSCNKGLGFFKDNPALLERASDFVLSLHNEIRPYELTED